MSGEQLLVVVVADDLRDRIVDTLIGLDDISGFTLSDVEGYSREHQGLSLREQVAGHRGMARFEVIHEPAQQGALVDALAAACGTAEVRYWLMPLAAAGRLRASDHGS